MTKHAKSLIANHMQQEYLKPECEKCSPNGYCVDKFTLILHNTGGRLTDERLGLLKIICDIDGHFQPNDILHGLRAQGLNLSLTTVYRNLSLLVQAGIIRRTTLEEDAQSGGAWYEHIWDHQHHDHLLCSHCGKKIEFFYRPSTFCRKPWRRNMDSFWRVTTWN